MAPDRARFSGRRQRGGLHADNRTRHGATIRSRRDSRPRKSATSGEAGGPVPEPCFNFAPWVLTQYLTVRDAIDRLEWRVRIGTDFFGINVTRVFLSQWHGCVRFFRETAPSAKSVTLHARWTNPERGRFLAPQEQLFDFASASGSTAITRRRFR